MTWTSMKLRWNQRVLEDSRRHRLHVVDVGEARALAAHRHSLYGTTHESGWCRAQCHGSLRRRVGHACASERRTSTQKRHRERCRENGVDPSCITWTFELLKAHRSRVSEIKCERERDALATSLPFPHLVSHQHHPSLLAASFFLNNDYFPSLQIGVRHENFICRQKHVVCFMLIAPRVNDIECVWHFLFGRYGAGRKAPCTSVTIFAVATPEQIWKDHHRLHFHQWFIPSLCDVGGRETKDGGRG